MTNEELIIEAKRGCKRSYELLFERNDSFNRSIANRYRNVADEDEVLSTARLGMVKAYLRYDPSRGIKFITFASTVIENELRMLHRASRRSVDTVSMEEPLGIDASGNVLRIEDTLAGGEEDRRFGAIECADTIERVLGELPEEDRKLLCDLYLNGKTQVELAEELGLSQSYVSRRATKILKRGRRYVNETHRDSSRARRV